MIYNHEVILINQNQTPPKTAEECLQFGAHKMSHSMGTEGHLKIISGQARIGGETNYYNVWVWLDGLHNALKFGGKYMFN